MTVIDNKYNHGDTVYLKTDKEQLGRIVIAMQVYKGGELVYRLVNGTGTSEHYEFELTAERDELKRVNADA